MTTEKELIEKGHGTRHYSCGHESTCRCGHNNLHVEIDTPCPDCRMDEKAPPGWKGTVRAMKKHKELDNPFALAWWMKKRGAEPHYKNGDSATPTKKKRFQEWLEKREK